MSDIVGVPKLRSTGPAVDDRWIRQPILLVV